MYVIVSSIRVQDVRSAGGEIGSGDNAAGIPVRIGDPGYKDRSRRQRENRGCEKYQLHLDRAFCGRHRRPSPDRPGVLSALARAPTGPGGISRRL